MTLPAFLLERYAEKYEYVTPYLLGCSDCESFSVAELLDLEPGSDDLLRRLWLGYTEFYGSLELRRAIAGLYGSLDAEHVMVHSGGEEAIFTFMSAALEPGDHLVVHFPAYQSHFEIAAARGCRVTPWITREDEDWELDLGFLEKHLEKDTRAVVVCSPNNPTGYRAPPEKMKALAELSREHGFILFSDEVYSLLEHDGGEAPAPACDLDDRAVSLNVMSKSFGLGGLRIGWLATRNRPLFEKLGAFKDYTTICNNAPGELLAEIGLRHRKKLLERNLEIIRTNVRILDAFFDDHRGLFRWSPPDAGPIAFPSLADGRDAEPFCRDLRRGAGVLLLPGGVYGDAYRAHFRVGFGRRNLPESVARLRGYLEETAGAGSVRT